MAADIHYEPGSFVGPFEEHELRVFEDWLHKCQNDRMVFDPDYVEHARNHHGGVPDEKYFQTERGTRHVIVRFLNFLSDSSASPLAQYRVEGTWGLIEDRLGPNLIPFAELFAGDMLCFEYQQSSKPKIVVWDHERSKPREPHTEFVADDFASFLRMLANSGK